MLTCVSEVERGGAWQRTVVSRDTSGRKSLPPSHPAPCSQSASIIRTPKRQRKRKVAHRWWDGASCSLHVGLEVLDQLAVP